MVRLGGTATIPHLEVFQGLETLFRRRGIHLDWVLYSDYDAMVEAFVNGEIDLAWNGPLGYVKIRRLLDEPCQVIAMRDVDIGFTTHFIARPGSGIETVEDLKGRRFAFGRRSSEQAGLVPHYLLKEAGINPSKDLAAASFYEERQSPTRSDERDVVERVVSGEFDAGAVSQRDDGKYGRGWHFAPRPSANFLLQPAIQPLLLYCQAGTGAGAGPRNRGRIPGGHGFRRGGAGRAEGRGLQQLRGWDPRWLGSY